MVVGKSVSVVTLALVAPDRVVAVVLTPMVAVALVDVCLRTRVWALLNIVVHLLSLSTLQAIGTDISDRQNKAITEDDALKI